MPVLIQRLLAGVGLVIAGPLILALAIAVRATSPGPAFHRAVRHHPRGSFVLYKLRTMRPDAASTGPGITAGGDRRVTRVGRVLRRWKLDELPQLWNVVRGDMLLVGPRPEDPRYVHLADPLHARVYGATPGLTSAAAVVYRDEEPLLAAAAQRIASGAGHAQSTADDLERAYRDEVQPAKLRLDAAYLDRRSAMLDRRILLATITGTGAERLAQDLRTGEPPARPA
jgi:lipopolysaccharide/colanic/teichoic acid biosynthesis glycosyltransferase